MLEKTGTLYLVGTPIGNLEDMTYRAVRILEEVDIIAAEDTRNTRKLLSHFSIHTPLTSYHEHNKDEKGIYLLEQLRLGKDIAVVSDAGLPGIADPGSKLAADAIAENLSVVPIPGANAALTALIASGLDTRTFVFCGFLPKTSKKRQERLLDLQNYQETLLFYEAPHRLLKVLTEMREILGGDRRVVLARELTKKFEEYQRGSLLEITNQLEESHLRGEYVIVLEGRREKVSDQIPELSPLEYYQKLLVQGKQKKEAMRDTAKQYHISRREVYQLCLQQKEEN